ncbi:hypothetical protein HORIV_08400 [Vreelandella olivaria]|uniref:Uncharacterized protein n=1 Tax=Vreelandella olivaria TaxID=390919 RepID=A0ABM7GCN6_9GAMM|nr:hypothetical protein HORIV_08400 [Halomonas olivaria]
MPRHPPLNPNGGDGGFVETSAAKVRFMDEVTVTTQADQGKAGELLIDPADYIVAPSGGDTTGESLSDLLSRTPVTLSTDEWGTGGDGDIFVNDEVSWSNSNQLTLNALRNIEINKTIQGGGKLVLKYGQANNGGEYQINAPIDLPAGQNFSTQLGSDDGNRINYTVITEYSSGSRTSLNNLQGTGSHLSGNYALGANIDASSTGSAWYNSWDPIGDNDNRFTGNFNGLGHTISDLNIDSDSDNYLGLFGSASSASIIRDIGLVGGNIKGGTRLGGLAGFNAGYIINAYTTGSVKGTGRIGGLVGFNEGNIVRAHATGDATGSGRDIYDGWRVGGLVGHNVGTITHSYATGHVKGDIHAGGLAGSNTGTITNAYATGNVETPSSGGMFAGGLVGINADGRIRNAYATGDVVGDRNVGGLVGRNDTQAHNLVTIRNAYATGKATGNSDVGGLVGDRLGYTLRVVIDSYYATTRANGNAINRTNDSGDGTGKSYAELTELDTFRSAWGSDIDAQGGTDSVWRIYDGHTTPLLRSFLTPVTVTPDNNDIVGKTYDGDAATGTAGYTTDVSGAMLDGSSLTYTTDAADAGTYDSLNFSGLYSHQQGYDISYDNTASITIDPRPLTINGTTVQDKTYDGSTDATDATITAGTLDNLVPGEDLNVATNGRFDSADAGSRNVTVSYALSNGSNGQASNYTTPMDSTHSATINKASLTVAAKDDSKTYDGQAYSGGNGVTYSGFVNNEDENKLDGNLTYSGTSQGATNADTYDITPDGLSATNYALTFESGKLTIDPRPLAISGTTVANKTYDGTTDATVTAGTLDNLIAGEDLNVTANGSFDNANAGSRNVTASYTLNDGTNGLANNYRLADTTHTATIEHRLLTINGTHAEDKTYDGTTDATATAGTLDNLVTGENLNVAVSGSFDNANAGSRTVTASYTLNDGTNGLANNYRLADTTHAANIDRRPLTISGTTVEDKTYDGTTDATIRVGTLNNLVAGEALSVAVNGSFNSANAGQRTATASYTLTDDNNGLASNYTTLADSTHIATISKAPLDVTANNDSRTYDGQAYSGGNGVTYAGFVNSEDERAWRQLGLHRQ